MEPRKKRKRSSSTHAGNYNADFAGDVRTIFSVLLASLCIIDKTKTKMKKKKEPYFHQLQLRLLNQLNLSLLSTLPNPNSSSSQLTLPPPILSLLPPLLTSKCAAVVRKCSEFVGAASLFSLEMNEQLAGDDEIVRGLIFAFSSGSKRRTTLVATCNAILDMSSTSIGRQRLLQFHALNSIIFCFLQVPKSSKPLIFLFTEEKQSRIVFKEDELLVLLFDAAITLINVCQSDQLEMIPRKLSETLLAYLKRLWAEVHKKNLSGTILRYHQHRHYCISNIRTNDLAESIFRLSINGYRLTVPVHMDIIKESIFGCNQCSYQQFILNHWEMSPLFVGRLLKASNEHNDIFSSFKQSVNFNQEVSSFLPMILNNLKSCLPISSEELDIFSFLKEVKSNLGCPMIYQQDIRVLKCIQDEKHLKREMHFFQEYSRSCYFQDPQYLYVNDILRCKEAYQEGFTISLRGMEFRFGSIASIVDGLAYLFGQPSAGVNMYLTPPNSQGLACHCDDHCVFICQLIGVKQWKVSSQSSLKLPRLYEPVDSLHEADASINDGYKHFLLREGDILYVPRGFLHEASTIVDADMPKGTPDFSLHLTLSIEVEPPFEWEGFAHVALRAWYQNHKQSDESLSRSLTAISVSLMHAAIKLIGDADATFRKACLVGAISFFSDCDGWLHLNQKSIFDHLVESIGAKSRFSDALRSVEVSLQENEDPLQRIKWLQHLYDDEEKNLEFREWEIPSFDSEGFSLINQQKDEAEAAFMLIKCKFCREVVFENVEQCYKLLLEKYRKVRKQYANGMLSLHCN
ncbi:uncharacterized protein LOC127794468 [Diospyros lotus]|uniref:uncharacterized protein LOC127794468 n=1 Tax=Diospyros lotus TaxID=55363 RepID=UPI00224E39EE|nr:uncharacterized protein LOC127794468 [Diospyros lotus]